jgi:hypothetical protein
VHDSTHFDRDRAHFVGVGVGVGMPNWIVNDFNALVTAMAAQDRSFVTVLNVNHILSPNGLDTRNVGGLVVRAPDNVHVTMVGVRDLVDPILNPMALAVGSAVYRSNA